MRRLLAIATLLTAATLAAGCWRGAAPADEAQPSFVAQLNALGELRRNTDALVPKLEYTMQRIIGLASEAERDAIRADLAALETEIAGLSRYVVDCRASGEDVVKLDAIERKLERAALAVVQLREELVYAKTTAQLAALDELSRRQEDDRDELREQFLVRLRALADQARVEPVELLTPPQLRATVRLRRAETEAP